MNPKTLEALNAGLIKPLARSNRYVISRDGVVYDTIPKKTMPGDVTTEYGRVLRRHLHGRNREYWSVNIELPCGRKTVVTISRLLAECFIPRSESDGCVVRHINENDVPRNDSLDNLKWGTDQDNSNDRIRNGKSCRGDGHALHKFSDEDVVMIVGMRKIGTKIRTISKLYPVSESTLSCICSGKDRGFAVDSFLACPSKYNGSYSSNLTGQM